MTARVFYRTGPYEFLLGPHWPALMSLRVPADAEPLAELLRVMREGGPTWPNAGPLSPRTLAAWRLLPEDRLTPDDRAALGWTGRSAAAAAGHSPAGPSTTAPFTTTKRTTHR